MEYLIVFLLASLAIERFTEITSRVDLLDGCRKWWGRTFPRLSKLAACKACQGFWTSMALSAVLPFSPLATTFSGSLTGSWGAWVVLWFSLWGAALLWGGVMERHVDGAPLSVWVRHKSYDSEPTDD